MRVVRPGEMSRESSLTGAQDKKAQDTVWSISGSDIRKRQDGRKREGAECERYKEGKHEGEVGLGSGAAQGMV